jgi:hypothetical protein
VVAGRGARVLAAVAISLLALPACGWGAERPPRDGLAPNTARFTYGDRSIVVPLTACGRDGTVVLLAGRRGDDVLQAAADLGQDGDARTGVTADVAGDAVFGAFGADIDHGPAGQIDDVKVIADRLIIEGQWAVMDENYVPTQQSTLPGKMTARCPRSKDKDLS